MEVKGCCPKCDELNVFHRGECVAKKEEADKTATDVNSDLKANEVVVKCKCGSEIKVKL